MNNVRRSAVLALLLLACLFGASETTAETVRLSKPLTGAESRCLNNLLAEHFVRYPALEGLGKLRTETSVARADLQGSGSRAFIFVIESRGYCGSAGCLMLIGEQRRDGKCHVLTAANNDGREITVLRRRDHGYRRLYAPCELYFDGYQYLQVREECPTIDVQR
jgi:hypothetical protein